MLLDEAEKLIGYMKVEIVWDASENPTWNEMKEREAQKIAELQKKGFEVYHEKTFLRIADGKQRWCLTAKLRKKVIQNSYF